MRMEKSEDEENITETTVMLEMEEAEDRGSSQEFPPRENMTRTEFLARGGFQETCGAEYYLYVTRFGIAMLTLLSKTGRCGRNM